MESQGRHEGRRSRARRGRPSASLAVALFASTIAVSAAAQDRETARLAYVMPAGLVSCPEEASFRDLVAARLGYDPFQSAGKHAVSVEVARASGRLRASARVQRQGQASPGARELAGALDQCEALVTALATTVAIALDPVRGMAGPAPREVPAAPPSPPPPPPPSRPAAGPPAAPQVAPEAPPARVSWLAYAGGVASVGGTPGPALGGEIGFGLRVKSFLLEAGARAEVTPGTVTASSGDRIQAAIYTGTLVPCFHHAGFSGCALLRFGALQARAPDVVQPRFVTAPYAAAGLRGGYTLHLAGPLSLRASLDVAFPLVRRWLGISGEAVWNPPPISGGLSLGLVVDWR